MRAVLIVILVVLGAGCTSTRHYTTAPSDDGVAAYRLREYERAWMLLSPLATKGHYRAQRYLAFMLLEGNAPIDCGDACASRAVDLLIDAASRGDNNSIIVLEGMRASGQSYAPSDPRMLEIERLRADRGDPVMAWRMAERYRTGEGVEQSDNDAIRWLKIVASTQGRVYSKSADAAYRLCEIYLRGDGVIENIREATYWCRRAAKKGHSGAVIVLARLENG